MGSLLVVPFALFLFNALNRNKANGTTSNDPISQRDINKVLELTQGIALPPDRDILHTIPQEFIVDTLEKIDNPIGLSLSQWGYQFFLTYQQ